MRPLAVFSGQSTKPASDKRLPHVSNKDAESVLADCLALFSENDPRLAAVIRAWSRMDDDVKESMALKAAAQSCEPARLTVK